MKKKKTIALAVLSAICVCALAASTYMFSSDSPVTASASDRAVAATLDDGAIIYEDDVTDYIADYREYIGATDDDTWSETLEQYDYTPETLREMTIYELASKQVIAQAADDAGLEITDDDVDSAIEAQKEALGISSDEAWQSLLDMYDTDEDTVRSNISYKLLESAVYKQYVEIPDAADDEIVSYLVDNYSGTTAHLIMCVSSSDPVELGQLLAQMQTGGVNDYATFASYVAGNSDMKLTDDPDGVLWWDIEYPSSDIATDFKDASVGYLYGDLYAVSSAESAILFCGQTYAVSDTLTSLDDVPQGIREYASTEVVASKWASDCKAWLQDRVESSITISPMPDGLSYDI